MTSSLAKLRVWLATSFSQAVTGQPAPFIKDEMENLGWTFKTTSTAPVCAGGIFLGQACITEAIAPDNRSILDDESIDAEYRRACRTIAEKRYNPA